MRWFSPFLLAACALCGTFAGASATESDSFSSAPPLNALVAQFDAVAMGHEHGARPAIIRKWDVAPKLALFTSPGFDIRPYLSQIVEQVKEIAGLSGLSLQLEPAGAEASLRLGFFPRADFAALDKGDDNADDRQFVRTSQCLGVSRLDAGHAGRIVGGAIMIGTDIEEALRRHCLLEEMVQMMGLPNDACNYRPSLFCESDHVFKMTKADIVLLETLYDPRLTAGMPREQALPIAREILSEHLAAVSDQ